MIQPIDIVQRIRKVKPFWFHGNPKIELIGDVNTFGTLKFDFIDKIIEYKIR